MEITKENARALWEWQGEQEWAEHHPLIISQAKRIARLSNQLSSAKHRHNLKMLHKLSMLVSEQIHKVEYLQTVKQIKEQAK